MSVNTTIRSIQASLKKVLPKPVFALVRRTAMRFVCFMNQPKMKSIYFNNRSNIAQVMEMLDDGLSKETLSAYMKLMAQGNVAPLKRVTRPLNKQYFDETVYPPPRIRFGFR